MSLSNVEIRGNDIQPPPKASLLNHIPMDALENKNEKRIGHSEISKPAVPSFPGRGPTDPYATWVVVYGFSNNTQYKSLLARFDSFGTVLSHHGSDGSGSGGTNWVCLRYETTLQAEKAICQHGTLLDGGAGKGVEVSIIGVMRVDVTLARKLGLSGPEGGAPSLGSFGSSNLSYEEKEDMMLEERDILIGGAHHGRALNALANRRENDICGKVVSWIFGW